MARVTLIHWKAAELEERVAKLRDAGHEVIGSGHEGPAILRALRDDPPDAVVIDLGRLPSHGREVGKAIRQARATRAVALVFVDGKPGKVERVRAELPDATFTRWDAIALDLPRAIATPPIEPVVPAPYMDQFRGTPLTVKLGIKPGATVALLGAPDGFPAALGELPDGVQFRRRLSGKQHLAIWFVTARRPLQRRIASVRDRVGRDGLWIAWPKKSSPLASDLTQNDVRRIGLDAGLVDYKICAIDENWSGLKFAVRDRR